MINSLLIFLVGVSLSRALDFGTVYNQTGVSIKLIDEETAKAYRDGRDYESASNRAKKTSNFQVMLLLSKNRNGTSGVGDSKAIL